VYLVSRKNRPVILKSKVEGFPDDRPVEHACLIWRGRKHLSLSFWSVSKSLGTTPGLLERCTSRPVDMGLSGEAMQQMKVVLEIYERPGHKAERAHSWPAG
jgi:hypothetical protein